MAIRLKQREWQYLGECALGALQHLQRRRLGDDVATIDLRQVIVDEALAQGVPPEIATSVAIRESGIQQWRPDGSLVTGTSGEIGIFQLMPATAAQLGVDPEDPIQNIHGGVKYLAQLYSQFNDWSLALAAYNWGPGNLQRALSSGRSIPAQVQNYVSGVLLGAGLSGAVDALASSPASTTSGNPSNSGSGNALVAVSGIAAVIAAWNWLSGLKFHLQD